MKEKVLHYFYNNHDNRSTVIAKHFNLKVGYVDNIIDEDLSKKANYMPIIKKRKNPDYITCQHCMKPVEVYDMLNDFVGSYISFTECEKKLGLSNGSLTHAYTKNGKNKVFHINHRKLGKYTYKLK